MCPTVPNFSAISFPSTRMYVPFEQETLKDIESSRNEIKLIEYILTLFGFLSIVIFFLS